MMTAIKLDFTLTSGYFFVCFSSSPASKSLSHQIYGTRFNLFVVGKFDRFSFCLIFNTFRRRRNRSHLPPSLYFRSQRRIEWRESAHEEEEEEWILCSTKRSISLGFYFTTSQSGMGIECAPLVMAVEVRG